MMHEPAYEIKLDLFEGPFDLLLFFIERDELNIHDIPIAKITDDFLAYIQQMQSLNIELASEFIFVASTLMRIKAKMLLPRSSNPEDPENEIDLKRELVQKLLLYKQFKEVCEDLRKLEYQRSLLFHRGNIERDLHIIKPVQHVEDELSSVSLYKLLMVYDRIMHKYVGRTQEVKHTVVKYPYTIEQQKKYITDLIELNQKLDFSQIARNSDNKVHFVYNFLAILEMLQQRLLDIEIGLGFNNFSVEKKEEDTAF